MKRNLIFTLLFLAMSLSSLAGNVYSAKYWPIVKDSIGTPLDNATLETTPQSSASALLDADGNVIDTSKVKLPNTYAWQISRRLGVRTLVPMDTVRENYHRSTLVEGQGIAMSYLGNIGGPVQSKEFFAREDGSQFPFMDAYSVWRRSPDKQLFLNTKIPYSNVEYQAGGGKQSAENRFKAELSSNFGKKLNVGFNFDYIYARGFYQNISNKQISYDFNTSYIGDKYKMHAFVGNNNLIVLDNGGITDDRYITDPDAMKFTGTGDNSLGIPVNLHDTKNKLRGRHVYVTNRYDIGSDTELVQVNDSTTHWRKKDNYISPASVIFTTHYTDQRRRITSTDIERIDEIYPFNLVDAKGNLTNQPKYDREMNDYMSHYTFTNTLALSMNEGFRSWTKFGLTVYLEHEMRRFLIPSSFSQAGEKESDDLWAFGGTLSKNQGKLLKYNLGAYKGINSNDLELDADVSTSFNVLGKELSLKAKGYFKNQVPNFFQENFSSRNWVFRDLGFNDTKRFFVGGDISLPTTKFSSTTLSGGYENITDYIYLGSDRKPTQETGNVSVLSLKLNQKFQAGVFHFDADLLWQKSTNETAIPLPTVSAYANMYLQTMVSKVLMFQLGADVSAHTKYYAAGYDPLQIQFYNQQEVKIGNFPHANVYINLHLKYTRFFIMMYNVTDGMGANGNFMVPHYPTNPRMLKWGLSWKFNN